MKSKIFTFYLLSVLVTFIINNNLYADKYRIFFYDKGTTEFSPNTDIYNSTVNIHNKRCIERRKKVLNADSIFTIDDAPIYQPYISQVINAGAKVLQKLRWKNYLLVECDSLTALKIANSKSVKKVQKANKKITKLSIKSDSISRTDFYNCGNFYYGQSFNQLNMIHTTDLHKLGITGKNTLIGIIDCGFKWREIPAIQNANVISEYDFINNDSLTTNIATDTIIQDFHGSEVMSVIAAYKEGEMIGVAPSASFMLAKTEFVPTETLVEEDYYSAAVEWMESNGVDIITASLGYSTFDSTDENYTYDEFNGNSTVTSMAVNDAVRRGVICFNAAGNNGPNGKSISTPGDADSVITVGAVNITGDSVCNFSSRGPLLNGKIKPDFVAQGFQVFCVDPSTSEDIYKTANGTSLSTPLLSGSTALLLSCFPELTPYQTRQCLYSSANNYSNPNDSFGYGLPNFYNAMLKAGIVISPTATFPAGGFQRVFVYIISSYQLNDMNLYIKFFNSDNFSAFNLRLTTEKDLYVADIPTQLFSDSIAQYYIVVNDLLRTRRLPYNSEEYLTLVPNTNLIPCGMEIDFSTGINFSPLSSLKNNVYIYPSISYKSTQDVELNIKLAQASNISYQVYNLLGNLVIDENQGWQAGGIYKYNINVSDLVSGTYFVKVNFSGTYQIVSFSLAK